ERRDRREWLRQYGRRSRLTADQHRPQVIVGPLRRKEGTSIRRPRRREEDSRGPAPQKTAVATEPLLDVYPSLVAESPEETAAARRYDRACAVGNRMRV